MISCFAPLTLFPLLVIPGLLQGADSALRITSAAVGPTAGAQRNVDMAWSAAQQRMLAVWDDKRPSAGGAENIYGRIVQASEPFVISAAAGDQKRPAAAGTADGFIVFWEDRRNTILPGGPRDIYAAIISGSGAVRTPAGIAVSTAPEDESDVEAEGSASGVLAVWERAGQAPGLMMARTDTVGTLLDAAPLRLTSAIDDEPDIAAGPADFLVVWERRSSGSVMAARVSWTGAGPVQTGPEFTVGPFTGSEAEPEVIWNGAHFLVTWAYRGADSQPATIVGRRVQADGGMPDPLPVTLASNVYAKDRALLYNGPNGCVRLITRPAAPSAKVLEVRQVCYGGVIEVTAPVAFTDSAADYPEDPAAIYAGSQGSWIAWEDSRYNRYEADEDIYLKSVISGRTYPATLLSTSRESPRVTESPVVAGDWQGWLHSGVNTASGLVISNITGGPSFWFPANQSAQAAPAGSGNRPGLFTLVKIDNEALVAFRTETQSSSLTADWFSNVVECQVGWLPCGPNQRRLGFDSFPPYSVASIAGVSSFGGRPAVVSVVSRRVDGWECALVEALPGGILKTRSLGLVPAPTLPIAPSTLYGTKIAASGGRLAVVVWTCDATDPARSGEAWLRMATSQSVEILPVTDWLPVGQLTGNSGPELTANAEGAVIFLNSPPGPSGWVARRIRWDGTLEVSREVSSQVSSGMSVVAKAAGFFGMQRLPDSPEGAALRLTEWDNSLTPLRAWRWNGLALSTDPQLQEDGETVRFTSTSGERPAYGIWRPLRIGAVFWNAADRSFGLSAIGPAGIPIRIGNGPAPDNFTAFSEALLERPGPVSYPVGGPGWCYHLERGLTSPVRFFRVEAPGILRVAP